MIVKKNIYFLLIFINNLAKEIEAITEEFKPPTFTDLSSL